MASAGQGLLSNERVLGLEEGSWEHWASPQGCAGPGLEAAGASVGPVLRPRSPCEEFQWA